MLMPMPAAAWGLPASTNIAAPLPAAIASRGGRLDDGDISAILADPHDQLANIAQALAHGAVVHGATANRSFR